MQGPNPGMMGGPAPAGAEKKGVSLFSSKPKTPAIDPNELNNHLNTISLRLRVLEERYSNLRKKIQLIEQNMLSAHRGMKEEVRMLDSDFTESKRQVSEMNKKVNQIVLELRNLAGKEELNIVKKYVDMWEPVHFITFNQAEKMIAEEVERQIEERLTLKK